MNIGDRIKQCRKALGMTQLELSEATGVSRVAIGNYERNDRIPPADVAARIADSLNISLDMLIYDSEELEIKNFKHHFDQEISKFAKDEQADLFGALWYVIEQVYEFDPLNKDDTIRRLAGMLKSYGLMLVWGVDIAKEGGEERYCLLSKEHKALVKYADYHKYKLVEYAKAKNPKLDRILAIKED